MSFQTIGTRLGACVLFFALTPGTHAQSFEVEKLASFSQTSSNPPIQGQWYFSARFIARDTGQVNAILLETPNGIRLESTGDRYLFFFLGGVSSAASLDSAFPGGDYRFTVTGGSLTGQSAVVTMPGDALFPPMVPAFDADTFERLKAYDPSLPFTFSWNTLPENPDASRQSVNFWVRAESATTNAFNLFSSFVAGLNSATVPATGLLPNTAYRAVLVFNNSRTTTNAGFGGFDSVAQGAYFTQLNFVTGDSSHASHAIYRLTGQQTSFGNGRVERARRLGYLIYEPATQRGTEIVTGVVDGTNQVFAVMPFVNHRVDHFSGRNESTYTTIAQTERQEGSDPIGGGTVLQATYLRGRDGTVAFGPGDSWRLPKTWTGWSREIIRGSGIDSGEAVESSGSYEFAPNETAASARAGENLGAAVERLAAGLEAKGYVRLQ